MKLREEFVVAEAPSTLWEFFEQLERVAQCVPGVEEVTVLDADNSRLRVTQSLGPMTATFDVKMRITARDPGRSMEFTAVGRSIRGAAGNVRATHTVRLENGNEGVTRVVLEGDIALAGMLGSVGQKVVAKQAALVTQSFARAMQRELSGEEAALEPPSTAATEQPTTTPVPGPTGPPRPSGQQPAAPASRKTPPAAIAVLVLLGGLWLLARWLRARSHRM